MNKKDPVYSILKYLVLFFAVGSLVFIIVMFIASYIEDSFDTIKTSDWLQYGFLAILSIGVLGYFRKTEGL